MARTTIKNEGAEELAERMQAVADKAAAIAAQGLYVGAGLLADELNRAIDDLQTEPYRYASESNPRLCSPQEKAALQRKSVKGIAKFQHTGDGVDTLVGLQNSGYTSLYRSKSNPAAGKIPVPLLARSIESGTTFRIKQPFVRKAVRNCKGKVSRAISEEIDKRLQQELGG